MLLNLLKKKKYFVRTNKSAIFLTYNIILHPSITKIKILGLLYKLNLVLNNSFFIFFISYINSNIYNKFNLKLNKKLFFCYDYNLFNSIKLNYYFSKNFISLLYFNLNIITTKSYFLSLGISDSLTILGYARRSWYSKSKKSILFKIGKSYINKFLIPSNLLLILVKKRLIHLFTYSQRLLKYFSYKFYNLKAADSYKGFGIRLTSKKLVLKDIFVKK